MALKKTPIFMFKIYKNNANYGIEETSSNKEDITTHWVPILSKLTI